MGRFLGTGTAQPNSCINYNVSTCYQTSGHKYAYDPSSCWQNRIIMDTPGTYTFTVPSGITCLRSIAVGGGGKSRGCSPTCCGMAGAGGGYVERWDTVTAGTVVTVTVGRQEQDTTISYTNAASTARTLTAGGAIACTPGAASGGDWNSCGGCAGYNCSYCGGSYSHYCGSCITAYATTCCGYCVVYSGHNPHSGGWDPDNGGHGCCTTKAAGGGSAGSWIWPCGGAGQIAGNMVPCMGDAYGATAGGGGGVGYITRCPMLGSNCSCMCVWQIGYPGGGSGFPCRKAAYPSSAGGGGGTKYQSCTFYDNHGLVGICSSGVWPSGPGGWGGKDNNEGREQVYIFQCSPNPNNHSIGQFNDLPHGPGPKTYPWHDIHEMAGSGSTGRNHHDQGYKGACGFVTYNTADPYSWMNAGEGAGSGGYAQFCCALPTLGMDCFRHGADACGTVNWTLLCCLGVSGRICCADKMQDVLFPYVISCAGTLGGAGGVTVCHLASKAGKGGGAGITRSYLMCVCWGGSYDLCNGTGPALAFPPCALDWRVSTAGTGMALIYWKDA